MFFASLAMLERAYRSGIGLQFIQQVKLFQNSFLGALNGWLMDALPDENFYRTLWETENNIDMAAWGNHTDITNFQAEQI